MMIVYFNAHEFIVCDSADEETVKAAFFKTREETKFTRVVSGDFVYVRPSALKTSSVTPPDPTIRLNERIDAPEVRVIDSDGSLIGILATTEALRRAGEQNLDLAEVNPKADPPVCKILNWAQTIARLRDDARLVQEQHPRPVTYGLPSLVVTTNLSEMKL
jgi:hypothetical protein